MCKLKNSQKRGAEIMKLDDRELNESPQSCTVKLDYWELSKENKLAQICFEVSKNKLKARVFVFKKNNRYG